MVKKMNVFFLDAMSSAPFPEALFRRIVYNAVCFFKARGRMPVHMRLYVFFFLGGTAPCVKAVNFKEIRVLTFSLCLFFSDGFG